MKRKTTLSDTLLGIITITMIIFLVPLVVACLLNASASLLCISIFILLLETEFLFLCFIPNWKLLSLLKRNAEDKQVRVSHFLASVPFFLIGGYVSAWAVSNLYQEINAVFRDHKAGVFKYYYQGKFPGWVTYSMDRDPAEFIAEIILRYFFAGLWGFVLEFGVLIITIAFVFIIRPAFRKT